MKQDFFIGVDAGGTKCKVRVENSAGELLGEACGGPANISYSVPKSWDSVMSAVAEALANAGLASGNPAYNFHAGFGFAGLEIPEAAAEIRALSHPFASLNIHSDSYAACIGAHNGADGGIIIVGTGIVGLQVVAGKTTQVAGWGFPYSDEGSGAWLGMEAARITLQAVDGRRPFSPLLTAIFAEHNSEPFRLAGWAHGAKATEFASLAPLIFEHAERADPNAVALLQQCGSEVERILTALTAASPTKVSYSLIGGVASRLKPWLQLSWQQRIVERQLKPAQGAILIAKKKLGLD